MTEITSQYTAKPLSRLGQQSDSPALLIAARDLLPLKTSKPFP